MLDNTKASLDLLNLLIEISDTLSGRLGFGPTPSPVRVYCNLTHPGCNWYTLENEQPQPIFHPALTGRLQNIRFEDVERRGEETYKLLIEVKADKAYILEAKAMSPFSLLFLNCCARFGKHELHNRLVTIAPYPDPLYKNTLLCQVWVDGKPVKAGIPPLNNSTEWWEITSKAIWEEIVRKAIEAARPA